MSNGRKSTSGIAQIDLGMGAPSNKGDWRPHTWLKCISSIIDYNSFKSCSIGSNI